MPKRRDEDHERAEHQRDDREPGDELAVDDVVAVDRLGEQPRQRPLGALGVDPVEPERDADERDEQRRERDHRHAADLVGARR